MIGGVGGAATTRGGVAVGGTTTGAGTVFATGATGAGDFVANGVGGGAVGVGTGTEGRTGDRAAVGCGAAAARCFGAANVMLACADRTAEAATFALFAAAAIMPLSPSVAETARLPASTREPAAG